ncbi:MAG: efflux RND transporter permease subunit, partial [Proteobacteria bacterium]|nr:efflux RND transporter permease subunit [Pseudomonadota bacterium]
LGLSTATLILVIILYAFFGHGVEFFPDTDPNKVFIEVETPLGTNVETTDAVTKEVEKIIHTMPEDISQFVANVGISTGAFDFGGDSAPSNKARVAIDFIAMEKRKISSVVTTEKIREKVESIIGGTIKVAKEEHGPPTGPPVNIEISGDDYEQLGSLAAKIRLNIKDIPGLVDLEDDYKVGRPEVKVWIDRDRAALYDLTTRKIASTIQTAIKGTEASTYRELEEEYDITVRFIRERRNSIQDIKDITIAHEGKQIPLSNVARIELAGGPGTIMRKDLKRVITISAEAEGRLSTEVLKEVQESVATIDLPAGYSIKYTGEQEEQKKSEAFLKKAFIIAVLLIAFILVLEFNSIITSSIIMFSVLLSLIGVFAGLMITGTPFGIIMTGIGVISLAGVVVNNAIVLLDYIIQLRERGQEKREAIINGGMTRLRPVLLTAVTTILGLLPMATGYYFDFKKMSWITGSESSQWWGPMAVAVIFGLAFATILTLVVVPVMYSVLESLRERVKQNLHW